MLRQHVTPDVRMHGIYKKAGVVPNIVPEEASVHFYMRAVDKAYLQEVHRMVDDCARGAAIMTQTTWDTFKVDATYDCMKNNPAGISVMKEVYEELGIDLPTAIRMFLKRSVVVNGVPFSMTLPKQEYRAERAIRAMQSLSEAAQQNGTADMSLDEINAEIAASRADRASRNARNGA